MERQEREGAADHPLGSVHSDRAPSQSPKLRDAQTIA